MQSSICLRWLKEQWLNRILAEKNTCQWWRGKNMRVWELGVAEEEKQWAYQVSLSALRGILVWLAGPRELRPCVYLSGSICVAACERLVCNHSSSRPLSFARPGSSCGGNTLAASQMIWPVSSDSREIGTRRARCKPSRRGALSVCLCMCLYSGFASVEVCIWRAVRS